MLQCWALATHGNLLRVSHTFRVLTPVWADCAIYLILYLRRQWTSRPPSCMLLFCFPPLFLLALPKGKSRCVLLWRNKINISPVWESLSVIEKEQINHSLQLSQKRLAHCTVLNSALLGGNGECTKVTSLTQTFQNFSALIIAQLYFTQSHLLHCGKISELVLSKKFKQCCAGFQSSCAVWVEWFTKAWVHCFVLTKRLCITKDMQAICLKREAAFFRWLWHFTFILLVYRTVHRTHATVVQKPVSTAVNYCTNFCHTLVESAL